MNDLDKAIEVLSPKEYAVYNLIQFRNCEIAYELKIMEKTVKFHKTRLFKKLGVKNAWEIICRKNLQFIATAHKRPLQGSAKEKNPSY